MATHSSSLAWETPWSEETGGLQSMGLQRFEPDLEAEREHTQLQIPCSCLWLLYTSKCLLIPLLEKH